MSKIVTEQKSWFNWLKLALNIRSSVIRSIWRRVVAAMIFAGMINLIYSQGLAVNQPILSSLIPSIKSKISEISIPQISMYPTIRSLNP